MSRYLLTQSLISSWLYIYKAYDDFKEQAYEDFVITLNRQPKEQTPAMLDGINFENMINAVVDGLDSKNKNINEISSIVCGGQKQVALRKDKHISGIDFLLYGKLDYLKAGTIYDIKFSKKYEVGKFFDSIQHPFYMELCSEARYFEYLVSNGNDVFVERYDRREIDRIDTTVTEFIQFLYDCKLHKTYFEKWESFK